MNENRIKTEQMSSTSFVTRKTATPGIIFSLICLLIGGGLRLTVILNETSQLTIDRDAYLGIASSVADGRGYSSPGSTVPTAFRPPLYPLLLAMGMKFSSPAAAVTGINLLFGLLTIWLTLETGQRLQLGPLRFVAAGLVAVDPLLLQYAARPMTETVCTCLAAWWLLSATPGPTSNPPNRPTVKFLAGMAFGFLVLSRPTFWPLAGFWVLSWAGFIWRSTGSTARLILRNGILCCLTAAAVAAPWAIRNWLVFGKPILTTTHGGYTLLLGNNDVFYREVVSQPFGTVWPDTSQKQWEADLESELQHELGPSASELDRDNWQSWQARAYLKNHPQETLQAAVHRVRSLWNTFPQGDAGRGISSWLTFAVSAYYLVVLLAAAAGAVRVVYRGEFRQWWALFALIATVQIVHLLYWTNTRMRAPLTPAIGLFVVAALLRRHKDIIPQIEP